MYVSHKSDGWLLTCGDARGGVQHTIFVRGVARDILPPAPKQKDNGAAEPPVGQGRPGWRAVRRRTMDSRRLRQKSSCRRRIYVLELGRRRQEKSGFRVPLADMPGRYWKYGIYRLAVMGLEKVPLNQRVWLVMPGGPVRGWVMGLEKVPLNQREQVGGGE